MIYLASFLQTKYILKEDEEEFSTRKGLAFKTKSEDFYSLKDESSDEDKEFMTMIVHGYHDCQWIKEDAQVK